MIRIILTIGLLTLLSACSNSYIVEKQPLKVGSLPTPDTQVTIEGLGACTDSPDRSISFNSNHPIAILVHGCNGSAGRFRALAQLYAFHGQQAVCYSYDDRDSLVKSADKLVTTIKTLSSLTNNQNISVVGHSMGGLISRKAMENDRMQNESKMNIQLVTVSAPLSGIKSANSCSSNTLNWLSLGIVPGICWGITGDNWNEITTTSDFINNIKPLSSSVQRYLKIVTNEENTCRQKDLQGQCIESDYVFDLTEQYHPIIDQYSRPIEWKPYSIYWLNYIKIKSIK